MTLAQLRPGRTGTVVSVKGSGTAGLRLAEMGFVRGTAIRCLRAAPWGDPMEVCLRGYRLSLRRGQAELVTVEETWD